jgi:hypothetical protein
MPSFLTNKPKRTTTDSFLPKSIKEYKSPQVLTSPRVLFPEQSDSKITESNEQKLKSTGSLKNTILVKRSYGSFSSDKIEPPKSHYSIPQLNVLC